MSDILKFILENYKNLHLGDYAIIFIFVSLSTVVIYIGLRKIFSARYEAQKELIKLKDQTVETLQSHINSTKVERDDLNTRLNQKISELENLKESSEPESEKIKILHEEVLMLASSKIFLLLQRVQQSYQALLM